MSKPLFNRSGVGVEVAESDADTGIEGVHTRHDNLAGLVADLDMLVGDALGLGYDKVIVHWTICGVPDYIFRRL